MTSLFWGIIVILLCSFIGIYKSYRLKQRSILLREGILLSEKVKTFLIYEQTETGKLIKKLSEGEELSHLIFLKTCQRKLESSIPFPKAWEESIEEGKLDFLTQEDRKNLKMFSSVIGKSDVATQLGGIDLIIQLLRQSLTEAEKVQEEKGKLYRSLGVLSGIGIAILLL